MEAIRQLQVARQGAVKARSAALCQLGELLTTAPEAVRETVLAQRKTLEGQATVCARLRPDTARLDDHCGPPSSHYVVSPDASSRYAMRSPPTTPSSTPSSPTSPP